jgi:hypothetical protein
MNRSLEPSSFYSINLMPYYFSSSLMEGRESNLNFLFGILGELEAYILLSKLTSIPEHLLETVNYKPRVS